MNVELKPHRQLFTLRCPVPANDIGGVRSQPAASSGRRASIYKPAKSAMTSGRAGSKRWLLEFAPQSPPFIEPLMGWTGSTDPLASVRLWFPSREAAIAYAERQGLDYDVRGAEMPRKAETALRRTPLWPVPVSNAAPNQPTEIAVELAA
jgi:hypothetical protein